MKTLARLERRNIRAMNSNFLKLRSITFKTRVASNYAWYMQDNKIEFSCCINIERRSRQAMNLHTKSQKYYIGLEMMPELIMDNMQMLKDVIRMAWETQIKTVVLLCDTKDIKTVVIAVHYIII